MITTYSMSKIFLWDFELIFDIKNLMDCVRAKIFDSSLHYFRNPSKGKKYAIKQKEIKEQYFVIYILGGLRKNLKAFKKGGDGTHNARYSKESKNELILKIRCHLRLRPQL